jgi:putative flippase GtrA
MARNAEAKKTIWQMIKFAIVGVINTLVDFAVFQTLNLTLGWVYIAQVLGYTAGIINSYLWNSNWTFREQRTRSLREIGLFLLVNLASLGVSLGMMWLLREVVGITNDWVMQWMPASLSGFIKGDTLCKLIATVFAIAVNYLGNRLFVFKKQTEPAKTSEANEA